MNGFLALFDLIGILARRRYQTAERCFAALGLNHSEARVLSLLHQKQGSASQESLTAAVFVDRSNAGRAIKHLQQQGLVSRQSDPSDRRAFVVQITAKGRKAVAEISKLRKKIAQDFFGELHLEEAGRVVQLLRKSLTPQEDENLQKRLKYADK